MSSLIPVPLYGYLPPEVTIVAPVANVTIGDELTPVSYLYLSVNHVLFNGVARIERKLNVADNKTYLYNNIAWTENSFINPSFYTHRAFDVDTGINGTNNDIIVLLDPNYLDLIAHQMHHLTKYSLSYSRIKKYSEDKTYNKFVWYGGHKKLDIHFDWGIRCDNTFEKKHAYVTTTPFAAEFKESYISQHNKADGMYNVLFRTSKFLIRFNFFFCSK